MVVIRYITLPQRVASLAVISGSGGPSVPGYLHSALLYYHGIVAVGLLEGRVLVIDLNMDETVESKVIPASDWLTFNNTEILISDWLISINADL